MRNIYSLVVFQICILSILSGQNDSTHFLIRDWYVSGLADKDFKIDDIITFDTTKIDVKNNSNFEKWEFLSNGYFIYSNVRKRDNFGGTKGESVIEMTNDPVKWEIKKGTSDLIIEDGNVEGFGKFKEMYKVLMLSKSKLVLKVLNRMQCPKIK